MSVHQRSIPLPPQSIPFSYSLSSPLVAAARHRLLSTMKATVQTLSAEIARLEATGDLEDAAIEKGIDALGWAVDHFREEQEIEPLMASLAAEGAALMAVCSEPVKRGRGRFQGGLYPGGEAVWNRR